MRMRNLDKSLVAFFPKNREEVEELSRILVTLRNSWPPVGQDAKANEIAAALASLGQTAFKLASTLAAAVNASLYATDASNEWLKRQKLPAFVPRPGKWVRDLPSKEREVQIANDHVLAGIKRLRRLWSLARRQATFGEADNLHCIFREMQDDLLHVVDHLHTNLGGGGYR